MPRKTGRRLFSPTALLHVIAKNWRGHPLVSDEAIVNSIAATTTTSGLEVYAQLDERDYPEGIEVSDAELAAVRLEGEEFHPEWNYRIAPSGSWGTFSKGCVRLTIHINVKLTNPRPGAGATNDS